MKKIINGKRYDTATATRLAHYESSVPVGDFDWFEEDLYRKKSGEFFIHGQGNAASRYSRPAATGGSAGGEGIIPLTYEQAAAWGEAHMDAGSTRRCSARSPRTGARRCSRCRSRPPPQTPPGATPPRPA